MAHLLHLSHEWDFASYGTSEIAWTDDDGPHTVSYSSGIYRHPGSGADSLTHPSGGLAIANTAHPAFDDTLEAALDAQTTATPTVTYDADTNRYTLAMSGAVFSVTWSSDAQLRMRALLGFSGNLSAATSYTATLAPVFTIEPTKQALTNWTDVRAMSDAVNTRVTSGGDLRTVGPARVPFTAGFEIAHETDAQTLSEFSTRYCWQQFWNDAGRNGRLCYLVDSDPAVGSDLRWAFRLRTATFDESTHRREVASLRNRWRVTFGALIRGRW